MGNCQGHQRHRKNRNANWSSASVGDKKATPFKNAPSEHHQHFPSQSPAPATMSLPYAQVDSSLRALASQAEGFGRFAIGGLHGPLYHVTSLRGNTFLCNSYYYLWENSSLGSDETNVTINLVFLYLCMCCSCQNY